jgi:hypothetical protein
LALNEVLNSQGGHLAFYLENKTMKLTTIRMVELKDLSGVIHVKGGDTEAYRQGSLEST